MLDKLVESKNNGGENKRLSGFLLTTFFTVISILTFGLIYSLFNQSLAMNGEGLDVSALTAPVALADQPPPAPPVQMRQTAEMTNDNVPTRAINMQRTDESPLSSPQSVAVVKNKNQARPNGFFTLKETDSNAAAASNIRGSESGENVTGLTVSVKPTVMKDEPETEPPPIKQTLKKAPEKNKAPITGGVVNSKAINLVKPIYSAAARAIRAAGEVKVQVTIDENGKVISANAVSGHPLLRESAEIAAKSSKFTSTTLSNEKVKVTGIIIYNFALQ